MSFESIYAIGRTRGVQRILCTLILLLAASVPAASGPEPQTASIAVKGAGLIELSLSLADIQAMPPFFIRDVPEIPERVCDRKDQGKVGQTGFRSVPLRDLLYKAGMKFKRKWEPGAFIKVRNKSSREVAFSFGELFYSSIGRSILIAQTVLEIGGQDSKVIMVKPGGIHQAIVSRITAMVRRVGFGERFVFAGGGARSLCLRRLVTRELGVPLSVPDNPQTVGALGAAIYAADGIRNPEGEKHV